jgi:hypothetical protein
MTKNQRASVSRPAPKKRAALDMSPGALRIMEATPAVVEDPVAALAFSKAAAALADLRCDVKMACDEFTTRSGGVLVSQVRIGHAVNVVVIGPIERMEHRYTIGISVDVGPALKKHAGV